MKLVQKICISLETKSNFPKEDQTEDVTAPNNFLRRRISKKSTFVCSTVHEFDTYPKSVHGLDGKK